VIWLNPVALVAFVAIAAPILIHILAQRRAERFVFPTLRFLRPTRLTSIRRHVLEDRLLLAVRSAIVAAAVAAVAGPVIVTPARRDAWNRRIVRAVVVDARVTASDASRASAAREPRAYRAADFHVTTLVDGLRRATDWLGQAPPARRELLIVAPLTIGSLSPSDLAAVPADVGIAFERPTSLPTLRTIRWGSVRSSGGTIDRQVRLDGVATSVIDLPTRDRTAHTAALPIEVVASERANALVDAALTAVLARRVWSPPPGRRAQFFVSDDDTASLARSIAVTAALTPWMAEAIARMIRDTDLQQAAARTLEVLGDDRLPKGPWRTVAMSAAGGPLVVAGASGDRLLVVSAASPSSAVMPILIRALANAMAETSDLTQAEVLGIPDEQLNAWSRPASAPAQPRLDALDIDDRRWLWVVVLALLGAEAWLRRSARGRSTVVDVGETVRVA